MKWLRLLNRMGATTLPEALVDGTMDGHHLESIPSTWHLDFLSRIGAISLPDELLGSGIRPPWPLIIPAYILLILALFIPSSPRPVAVTLWASRGAKAPKTPLGYSLMIRLKADGMADGPVSVVLINSEGLKLSKTQSEVRHEEITVTVGRRLPVGMYFMRVYAWRKPTTEPELLREYDFQVR